MPSPPTTTKASSPTRNDYPSIFPDSLHPGGSSVHFLDHAVHGNAMDLIAGIFGQEVVGFGFTGPGHDAGNHPPSDNLPHAEVLSLNAGNAVFSAKIHRRPVGKGDLQKYGLRVFHVGMFLQNADRPACVAGHHFSRFEQLDRPRSRGGIHQGMFRDAGISHLEPGKGQRNFDQPANQVATTEASGQQRKGQRGNNG